MYKVWIGNRESEILTYNIFDESITFYGSNISKNTSYTIEHRTPSNYKHDFTNFVIAKIDIIVSNHEKPEFHFYNPVFAYKILSLRSDFKPYFANLIDYEILKWINSKSFVRSWLSKTVDVPPYAVLSKKECSIENLQKLFGNFDCFVVQKDTSGGGEGTYLLTHNSQDVVLSCISNYALFLVSPFLQPKISACCHMLVDRENVFVFPFGTQISEIADNRLLYKGTSYSFDSFFSSDIVNLLHKKANIIGERLRDIGYRGICGLDFIIFNDKVLFIEINARYLGSTFLINKSLKEKHLLSLFDLNTLCFKSNIPIDLLSNIEVGYTSNNEKCLSELTEKDINKIILEKHDSNSEIFWDGFQNTKYASRGSYLYREMFKTVDRSDVINQIHLKEE